MQATTSKLTLALTASVLFAAPALADNSDRRTDQAQPVFLAQQPGISAEAPAEEEKPAPLTYGGSADLYFSTNFNDPFTGLNGLHAWDVRDERGPHLGLVDLWAQYARSPVGGRLDLNFGPTSKLNHAFDYTRSDVWDNIQQAFVSANLDKAGRTYIDLGKWTTTAGVEVTEPRDNWLTSRGLAFYLVQPFYHTGGRVYHYFNDTDFVMAAVHRGYNATGNPHRSPGFAITGGKKLNEEMTFIGSYYGGDEAAVAGEGEQYRSLVDLILLYNPAGSRWAYTVNADIAVQGSANVGALSAQAKYQLTPKSYGAIRGEMVIDGDFVGTDVYSLTAGYAYMFNQNVQTRAELRYDWAGGDVFADQRRGSFKSNQPTFLLSAIVGF